MGVSFFEVMRGELEDRGGDVHPASFEIKAESPDLVTFLRTGSARITGVVDAQPWVDLAPAEGEIRISPIRDREIAYELRFQDADYQHLELRGTKDLNYLKPLSSFTELDVALYRDDEKLAEGELRFDIAELPEFVASWFPSSNIESRPPREIRGEPEDTRWSDRDWAMLEALAYATCVGGERVPEPDDETVRAAQEQVLITPALLRNGLRWALRALDKISLVKKRKRFASLSPREARGLLEELRRTEGILGRVIPGELFVLLLTAPVKAVHFGRRDYLDAIGHPEPKPVSPEPDERYMQRVVAPESLGEETDIPAHVVVVGTGAGGAAVASALAKKGLAVAILEEGRYKKREDFVGSPLDRVNDMFRYKAMNVTLGTPVALPQGRVVGGTTTVNSGTCFRTPDHVLREWRREHGFPIDFDPANYHVWSEKVSRMLQVEPGDEKALGKISDVIARGADRMGYAHGPLPRNAPGCPGAGECIFGCPEGAKRSTDVSYIPDALDAGAELYVGQRVTRILMRGSKAVAVEARSIGQDGEERVLRVRADRIVIACGSLLSPILLRENGINLPMLGKNMSVHPGYGVTARCHENLEPWHAIPQGYGIHALEDQGIRFEGYYLPPQLTAPQLPWIGEELTRWMDDFHRLGQFGFMVRDGGDGWVRRGIDGKPILGYWLSEESLRRIKLGTSFLARIFLEAGASEVFTGIGDEPIVRTEADARRILDVSLRPVDVQVLGAHPLGTCRMARNADEGVVDFDNRVFGTQNLHVVDGSVVPTSLGVNPQMTIMAMALRAGDVIAAKLGA